MPGPRKGGATAKMKKFPRIADYLQARHKKVYEIIDDLAMHGSLSPRRGGGITFLVPDDKLIAKIRKLIESDDPEVATDIVSSLIIVEYLPTVKEFAAHKDDIPTLLGKKLGVKAVSATKVDLDGGASLSPSKDFRPFDRSGPAPRGNMAVWDLKGEVEYEKAPKAEYKYSGKSPSKGATGGRKRGGTVYFGGMEDGEVDQKIQEVFQAEYNSIRNEVPGVKRKSPMLRAVVNQMNSWKNNNPAVYAKACSILSLHPIISFFLIFKNRAFIPASEITVVNGSVDMDDPLSELRKMVDGEGVNDPALIFSDRRATKKQLAQLRDRTRINVNAAKTIRECYAKFDREQSEKYYPTAATAAFQSMPGLHLLIDEFRHFMYAGIRNMNRCSTPEQRAAAFNDLAMQVNLFRSLTRVEASVIGTSDLVDKSRAVAQIQEPFWRGFAFFVPCSYHDKQKGYAYTGGAKDDDDEDRGAEDEELKAAVDTEREMESESKESLSEQCMSELTAWLDQHDGTLPAELADKLKQ